eukprot:jgi/Ulvmu1/8493/UM044_0027.1
MALEHVKWKEAVAGAFSGALTVLLLHPLDVIKTRLQVQEKGISNRYHSTVHAFKTIKAREGVRGLYSGLAPSLIGNAVSWGLYWVAWKSIHGYHCTQQGVDDLPWTMKLLTGMQAGVLVTLATNPLWVVKTRMQLESTNVPATAARKAAASTAAAARPTAALGLPGAVRSVLRTDGLAGFYRGLGPALLLCSHGAIQMMAYEELKGARRQRLLAAGFEHVPHADSLVIGAVAKLAASAFTYPLQVARSRMQQRLSGTQKLAYRTMPRAFVRILRKGGFTALYQGFTANAARVCPQAAVQFFLYEQARRLLG